MARIANGMGRRIGAGGKGVRLVPLSAVQGWLGSVSARRLARAFMFMGLAALIGAFTVKAAAEVRVGMMLAGVAAVEFGGLLAIRTRGPIEGFRRKTPRYAFVGAAVIAFAYIAATLGGNSMVSGAVSHLTPLKLVAVVAAVIAGFFEESLFRGVLMDRLAAAGRSPALQVLISGLVFGGLHFYAFAGLPAALLAQAATTVLGWALATLYLMSRRSLWPCIIAHILIDAALEPALLQSLIH